MFQKVGRNAFCFAFLSWVSSHLFQFNSMLFSIRDVLHHPDSFRCHDSLLPSSAIPLPVYIVQQSAVLSRVFIHKRVVFGARDLDTASCVSTFHFPSTFACENDLRGQKSLAPAARKESDTSL